MDQNNPNLAPQPAGLENQPQSEALPVPESSPASAPAQQPVHNQPPAAAQSDAQAPDPQVAQPIKAPVGAGPDSAGDVDVIEKEWVDAAEKVIKDNAASPHDEEEAFEDLQIDYLKKRYGKEIKKPEDQ